MRNLMMSAALVLGTVLAVGPLGPERPAHAAATPSQGARAYSCPLPGTSRVVYRLAWVEPGKSMRSGAVIVDGDHLAGERPTDDAAVAAAYAGLKKKYGVGAVVNLRQESAEDAKAAKAAGMAFLHLPITDGVAPTRDQVKRFFAFHDAQLAKKTVLLWHCAGGIGRTGVLAAMQRVRTGWRTEDAAREMFAMGLTYDQAIEHLPALNAFATGLGKPTWYPADWPHGRKSPHDYRGVTKALVAGR